MYKLQEEKEASLRKQRKQAIGKMAIGGDFELVDQDGKLRKNQDFLGKWLLIYFGFTRCPDICPDELEKMCRTVDLIEKVQVKDAKIQPIFITVDPSRDDVQTVAKYIKGFLSFFF
jgi:protein SCO1/2